MDNKEKMKKLTIKEIYNIVKTDDYDVDLYAKISNKIALHLVYLFVRTPISADILTLIMMFIGFGASAAFFMNIMWLGIVLMHLWYVFDWVDGATARLKNQCTKTGWYYDHLVHLLNHPLFFVSIGYALYVQTGKIYILFLSIIAAYAHLVDVSASDTYMMVLFKNLLDVKCDFKKESSAHKNANNFFAKRLHFPDIINVFTLSVIIDYVLKFTGIEKYFTITFVVVVLYSIVLPLYVILRFIKHITTKAIDKEFNKIVGK